MQFHSPLSVTLLIVAKSENSFLLIPTCDLVNLDNFRKRLFRKMSVLDEFDVLLEVVLDRCEKQFLALRYPS